MSTGTTTGGQLASHYDRIKRGVDTVKIENGLQTDLVGVSKAVLEMFPIDQSSPTTKLPDLDEIAEHMQSVLPFPEKVLTD